MREIPFFGDIIEKSDTVFIPFNSMTFSQKKEYISSLRNHLSEDRSFTYWPGGTRERNGGVGDFQEGNGTLGVILNYARKNNKEILISPQIFISDSIIESPHYKTVDFFKSHYNDMPWGKAGYIATDLYSFFQRYLRNRLLNPEGGIAAHIFGEPFSIHDYPTESQTMIEAQKRASALVAKYQQSISTWPDYDRIDTVKYALDPHVSRLRSFYNDPRFNSVKKHSSNFLNFLNDLLTDPP